MGSMNLRRYVGISLSVGIGFFDRQKGAVALHLCGYHIPLSGFAFNNDQHGTEITVLSSHLLLTEEPCPMLCDCFYAL